MLTMPLESEEQDGKPQPATPLGVLDVDSLDAIAGGALGGAMW